MRLVGFDRRPADPERNEGPDLALRRDADGRYALSVLNLLLPGNNRNGRFWFYLGDQTNRFVVHDYARDRSRDGPDLFLGDLSTGYLQSDAYSVYDSLHH